MSDYSNKLELLGRTGSVAIELRGILGRYFVPVLVVVPVQVVVPVHSFYTCDQKCYHLHKGSWREPRE